MGRCPTGTVPGGFQRGGRKRGLQTDLQNEIVQEIETLLGCQSIADLDFEAIEMAARRQTLRLAARVLEQRLNTDTSDHVGPQLPCRCGGSAQYHGRHEKTFESVLGPLHLQRAYYHCELCQSGFCPRDRALGLESFSLTPGVLRMTGSAAALVSFEESSGLLHKLAKDLELPKLTFQVIRRTIATLAQKKGTVKDVQGLLRHSRAATTTDVYMQEIPESVRATIDSIHRELRKSAKPGVAGSGRKKEAPRSSEKKVGFGNGKTGVSGGRILQERRSAGDFKTPSQKGFENLLPNATKPGEAEPLSCWFIG